MLNQTIVLLPTTYCKIKSLLDTQDSVTCKILNCKASLQWIVIYMVIAPLPNIAITTPRELKTLWTILQQWHIYPKPSQYWIVCNSTPCEAALLLPHSSLRKQPACSFSSSVKPSSEQDRRRGLDITKSDLTGCNTNTSTFSTKTLNMGRWSQHQMSQRYRNTL